MKIDTAATADQIINMLRAQDCDAPTAREILALTHMKVTRGDLHRGGKALAKER